MKRAAFAVALILCAPHATLAMNAPQPKPGVVTQRKMYDAAIALMNKMNTDNALQEQTQAMIAQQTASLNDVPCASNAVPEVERLLGEALDVTTMRNEIARVYANNFTLAELTWMLDFYDTPLGKKWLNVEPQITRTMTDIGTERMKEAAPKISTAIAVATKDSTCQLQLNRR